jgi:hypothetical protein
MVECERGAIDIMGAMERNYPLRVYLSNENYNKQQQASIISKLRKREKSPTKFNIHACPPSSVVTRTLAWRRHLESKRSVNTHRNCFIYAYLINKSKNYNSFGELQMQACLASLSHQYCEDVQC